MSTATSGRAREHRVLAIDPGNTESGYALIDAETCEPIEFGKAENRDLMSRLQTLARLSDVAAIEMVASYGMAVGADVFETCVWIGRFAETINRAALRQPELVKRQPVKVHHCHSAKARDSNIRQALVDRFAPGRPNHGKGTKAEPGWFYGFRADVWQAYALAVYVADTAQITENSHRTPTDGRTGSPEGDGTGTTKTTPQIATNPATDSTRNEDT